MRQQLIDLRAVMAKHGVDYCLVPSNDFHGSEYLSDHFKSRSWVSGFNGSAGTLLVGKDWAGLWTDGRYFIQAAQQLEGSGIELMNKPAVRGIKPMGGTAAASTAGGTFPLIRRHNIIKGVTVRIEQRTDLLQIAQTIGCPGAFTGTLQCRKQYGSKNGYYRDNHQQFNESEWIMTALSVIIHVHGPTEKTLHIKTSPF